MVTQEDYKKYIEVCKEKRLEPLASINELIMFKQLSALEDYVIPYLSTTGLGDWWVHNTRHKTKRKDRPFLLANMQALQEK